MTEPLSGREIAEAKALCEELPELCLVIELVYFADKCRTLVPRLNEGNVAHHTLARLGSFIDGVAGKRLTYKALVA